ncbi:hypothetical protein [Rhizobium sp. BK251]|nr:hypothetical protein [Rhizobium sp. BK251]
MDILDCWMVRIAAEVINARAGGWFSGRHRPVSFVLLKFRL